MDGGVGRLGCRLLCFDIHTTHWTCASIEERTIIGSIELYILEIPQPQSAGYLLYFIHYGTSRFGHTSTIQ